jgi:hypothetical protein
MSTQNLIRLTVLVLTSILAACGGTPQTAADIPANQASDQSMTVPDQSVTDGIVTVDEVTVASPSWVVIHPDDNGNLHPNGIGRIALDAGQHQNIEVSIDLERATRVLYAEIHDDLGIPGQFELLDAPAKPSVVVSFNVSLP